MQDYHVIMCVEMDFRPVTMRSQCLTVFKNDWMILATLMIRVLALITWTLFTLPLSRVYIMPQHIGNL